MYKLLKQENRARRGEFHTVHGTIQIARVHECRDSGGDQGRPLRV